MIFCYTRRYRNLSAVASQRSQSTSGWVNIEALLDTGAEINVIAQRFAVEHALPRSDAALPNPKLLSGIGAYCYGVHSLECRFIDSWGYSKVKTHIFYALDKDGPPLVLGLPSLRDEHARIDIKARTWRFGIEEPALEIEDAATFSRTLATELTVYALIVSGVDELDVRTAAASVAQPLPTCYADYADVFSTEEAGRLPQYKAGDHAIDLEGGEPPYGPLYNLSATELQTLRTYLDDALAKGWIRHSISPAGASVLFVPKKDEGLRLCVDYRGLNKFTIKNRHPLPLISETLDRLSGSKVFTKMDLKDPYHRLRIREDDEWKTAFRTRYGHFEYMIMPFGLANAPATFQAYINRALAGYVNVFCVVYLDDILVYSETPKLHRGHVRKVLERLRKFQLFVNLKKCDFSTDRVKFLGFIISVDGVAMDQSRVTAIAQWPPPKTHREIQVFLGFANFYRRFIEGYSRVASPMTDLLKGSKNEKKSGPFDWPVKAQTAFDQLLVAFTSAPILIHFDPKNRVSVETDASEYAVAGIFSQLSKEARWHTVAFWSRKMIPAEQAYETHDQELLAIVIVFKHWRHYFEGSLYPIEVLTDHNNLREFMNVKALNGRQAR